MPGFDLALRAPKARSCPTLGTAPAWPRAATARVGLSIRRPADALVQRRRASPPLSSLQRNPSLFSVKNHLELAIRGLARGVHIARTRHGMSSTYDIGLSYQNHGNRETARVPLCRNYQGKIVMKGLDSIIRWVVLALGTGLRWLREELDALHVNIPLTDGCLSELVRDADMAATSVGTNKGQSYVERLRHELALRANFIQRWTGSDEHLSVRDGESLQSLVRIARKYALPRRWKLSDPVVVEYRRTRPSY